MAVLPHIDPIKMMMDDIISKTEVEVKAGYKTESILHIKIDPRRILERLPRFLTALGQAKAQWDGHVVASGERPDKVIIHFDGHKYEAIADYEQVITNEFKGFKHGKD